MPPPPSAGREQPPLGIARHAEREVGAHVPDLPDHALLQPLHHLAHQRVAAVHVAFHQEDALLAGGVDHLRRRFGVERDRLLAQHRLAGGDRGHRHLLVERVRRRDVDRLDRLVREQLVDRRRRRRDLPLVGERLRQLGRQPGDVDDLAALRFGQRVGEVGGDAAGADDTPVQRFLHVRPALLLVLRAARVPRCLRAARATRS